MKMSGPYKPWKENLAWLIVLALFFGVWVFFYLTRTHYGCWGQNVDACIEQHQ